MNRERTPEQQAQIDRIMETCEIHDRSTDLMKEFRKDINERNSIIRKTVEETLDAILDHVEEAQNAQK